VLDTRTGRFLTEDPYWNVGNMTHWGGDTPSVIAILSSANLYAFVLHNPVEYVDPTGLFLTPRQKVTPPTPNKSKMKPLPPRPTLGEIQADMRNEPAPPPIVFQPMPFEPVPIVHDYIPSNTIGNKRPGTELNPTGIVIHSTGNATSTARNERSWLTNPANTRATGWHIVVDEREAIIAIPLDEVAFHAGTPAPNRRNFYTIGIEIAESGNRARTLRNAVWVTAWTLHSQGLDTSALQPHYDGGGCPSILQDNHRRASSHQTWDWFVGEVDRALQQF